MEIIVTHKNEAAPETMRFIESKRNWDMANQRYRYPDAENCKANLADCKIYWRGEYLIVEHEDIIHYWDSFPYCFLKQAVEFMEVEKPAKWKTLDKLIALRMGIRQTEVNHCGYVDGILMGKKMTLSLYTTFMRMARQQDFQHHGSHTF
jgi:hypothetical protein